jgi:hypothetical protein
MCAEPIADEHQHVVNVEQRTLLCACRPCYLLFTAEDAALRFRAVPDRYLAFGDFQLGAGRWDELEIPVGLAFVFRNSTLGNTSSTDSAVGHSADGESTVSAAPQGGWVAFYPGPAGATESMLPLTAWDAVVAANPGLSVLRSDVEALLLREIGGRFECFLVPIDSCYELVGRLRQVWRGFDGGSDARRRIAGYFDELAARARPASAGTP